ncbi:MAG TPA: AI-2E family transporter [Acidimicrobiia bacterium]|nr:AI-2E family transporter [Acidimicrobiia bacterium]
MSEEARPEEGEPARRVTIEVSARTVWQVIGAVLLTLVALWAMDAASHLLRIVALSFFFSLALQPLVMRLVHRFGWRRGSAVGIIYAALMIGLILMVVILIPATVRLAEAIGSGASQWIENLLEWMSRTLGITISWGLDDDTPSQIQDAIADWATGAVGNVVGLATSGIGFVFDLATIAMFTFYFTADAPRFQRAVLSMFAPATQEKVGWTWDQAIIQTGGYFYSRSILMAINGTGFFFTMVLVGLDPLLALPLAIFAGFVSEFIPAIGTYIGAVVPIAITLALRGWGPALVVLGYALVYQQIENYYLSPKISSNTMTINGAVAFGAALFGGAVAGPIGAFVALPVAALVTAFVSNYARHNEVVYTFDYENHSEDPGAPGLAPPGT